MRRARVGTGARLAGGLAAALLLAAVPAGAQQVETAIDLNYTYEQEHTGDKVLAATGYQQKYQVKLSTALTSSLDFLGALTLALDDKWDIDTATTSRVSPSLELGVSGPQSSGKFTYSGVINKTREFEEHGESTQYSNAADLDLELTPDFWPEAKFKLSEKRDYERLRNDSRSRIVEMQLRDDIFNVRMEFSLRFDTRNDTLPRRQDSDGIDWSWRATYKESLFGGVEFEAAYEIKEEYSEEHTRGAFDSLDETYTQALKARLKKTLELTPRLSTGVSWEYNLDHDLLGLDFDYKVQNKYVLDARFDVLPSLKVTGDARREIEEEAGVEGEDDTAKVSDTLKGAFDFEPVKWLRLGGKAELKFAREIEQDTGGSIDRADDEQYELSLKNQFADRWDLTASTSASRSYADDVIEDRETKFKATLKLRPLKLTWADLSVAPGYESTRKESWDDLGLPSGETLTSDARIKVEVKSLLLRRLKTTFSHEYGQKITHETDAVLDFTRELGFTENTRLNLKIDDLVEGLSLEGEVQRKADDTEGDAEEEVVVVTYTLKADWNYEELSLSSAFKYNDQSEEEDDTVDFTAKVGWKGERIDVSGDYQFTKTYADVTDEDRKLNLKLSYKF